MNISVADAGRKEHVWLTLEVPDGSSVDEVIQHSALLKQFPAIGLDKQRGNIFDRLTRLDALVEEGNRVEI